MATATKVEPDSGQEPGTLTGNPTWGTGSQAFGASSDVFLAALEGDVSGVEQTVYELVFWYAITALI